MTKVSVIIPIYNAEAYLRQCLDSVINQTLKDIEIICVDDDSTDGSPAILAEYAAKDPRVTVIAHEKSTAGVVRNVGLSAARGKYVAFFDSDDFIASEALSELYKLAELNKTEIVVSGVTRYAADGKRVLSEQLFEHCTQGLNPVFAGKDLGDSIFTAFLPAPWNKFYLTEFVRNNNLEFQDLSRCNDLCFTMTAFACAKRITVLNRACYCYRQGVGGSSQNTSDEDPLCVCRAYQELMNQLKRRRLYERHAVAYAKAAVSSTLYTFNLFHEMSSVDQLFTCLRSGCPEILETKLTKDDFRGNESAFGRYANLLSADGAAEFLLRELSFWRDLAVARDGKIRVLQFQSKKQAQELSGEIDELHKSFAYRVGMVVTWPARCAYRMFKGCLKRGGNRVGNLKSILLAFGAIFVAGGVAFAAHDGDVLSDLVGAPKLFSVSLVEQTNTLYRMGWKNPGGKRRFAKIIFPLPQTAVVTNGRYYYEFDLKKLVGEIDGMTLGRHGHAAAEAKSCFAGRYFGPVKRCGKYTIPMSALSAPDATVLDRIVLSSSSEKFSAEFTLAMHKGSGPTIASSQGDLDFSRTFGWMFAAGFVVSLLIKWLAPIKKDISQDFKVGRYPSVDVLKGLGCLAVVLIHYNFPGWAGRTVWASCRFAVPLFFCISGFFLIDRDGRITLQSLIRKSLRLAVLLTSVIVVYHMYLRLVPEFAPRLVGARSFGLTAGFWLNNSIFPVIWFIGALIYSYVFFILFCGRVNRLAFGVLAFTLWLGCLYLYDVNAICPQTAPFTTVRPLSGAIVWANSFVFRALPFLLIGLFLRLHVDSVRKWFRRSWIPWGLALLGCAVSVGEMTMTGRVQFSTGCTFSMIMMFAWAVGNPDGGPHLLRVIGSRASLWVYLVHFPIGTLLTKMAKAHGFSDETWFRWSLAVMVIILSLGFAFLVDAVKNIALRSRKQE